MTTEYQTLGEGNGMRYSRRSHPTLATRNADRRSSVPKEGAKRQRIANSRRHGVQRPKLPLREALAILRIIATQRATIADLTQAVRMSRATVYRILTRCKRDLGIRIECELRVFKLRDWGLLNRRRVLKKRGRPSS